MWDYIVGASVVVALLSHSTALMDRFYRFFFGKPKQEELKQEEQKKAA